MNRSWIQAHFPQLVLGLVAGGFALTLVELLLMHHTEGKQLIAIGSTALGALLCLGAVWARGNARTLLAGALGLVALTGLVGTVMHFEEANEEHEAVAGRAVAWVQSQTFAWADEEEEEVGREKGEKEGEGVPPLAPLSVTGLGMLGALAALVVREQA